MDGHSNVNGILIKR